VALVTFSSSEGTSVRVDPTAVVALEELSASVTRIHITSGRVFVVLSAIASVVTALGL
jgi:hypothetical protein